MGGQSQGTKTPAGLEEPLKDGPAASRIKSILDVSVLVPGAFRSRESQAQEERWSGLPCTVVPSVSYTKMAAGAGESGGW